MLVGLLASSWQCIVIELVIEILLASPHARHNVLNLEGLGIRNNRASPCLEGFVGELGTNPATHVAVGVAFVLVEHIYDTTVVGLGEAHLILNHHRGLRAIVDVGDEVFHTIDNHEVGVYLADGDCQQLTPLLPANATNVEDKELVVKVFDHGFIG